MPILILILLPIIVIDPRCGVDGCMYEGVEVVLVSVFEGGGSWLSRDERQVD